MGFRDDETAARARLEALEQELARTNDELARTKDELTRARSAPGPTGRLSTLSSGTAGRVALALAVLLGAGAISCGWVWSGYLGERVGVALGVAAALALWAAGTIFVMRNLLIVAAPNEAVVVSGRSRRRPDGTTVGYRVAVGQRILVLPLVEQAGRLDLSTQSITLSLPRVAVRDGKAVHLEVQAAVRISRDEPRLDNAVERFLGRPAEQVWAAARQTLEGVIPSVMATIGVEEATAELLKLGEMIGAEAEHDLSKLGLEVEVLRIVRVTPA